MSVYLAASYNRRAELQAYRDNLTRVGIPVTSTWLDGPEIDETTTTIDDWRTWQTNDRADILAADVLIAFTEEPGTLSRGGRHWEVGYASGLGKAIAIVGPVEMCFYAAPTYTRYDDWSDVLFDLWETVKS